MIYHKFHAKITEADGIKFSSKKEANFYAVLKARQQAKDVICFLMQVPIRLPGGVKFVCDFLTFDADGTCHFIDTKGFKTESYNAKKRMVEALYPFQIEER